MKKIGKTTILIAVVVMVVLSLTGCSLIGDTIGNAATPTKKYQIDITNMQGIGVAEVVGNNIANACVQIVTNAHSAGAGFLVTSSGYVVTNHHVVKNATMIQVTVCDKDYTAVNVVASDEALDIAILKISTPGIQFDYLKFAEDKRLNYGQSCFTMGNPAGKGLIFAAAIVSNPALKLKEEDKYSSIFLDCNINHGNSGGVLVNNQSQVVGMIYGRVESNSKPNDIYGMGLAIPAKVIKEYLQQNNVSFEEFKADGTTTGNVSTDTDKPNAEDKPSTEDKPNTEDKPSVEDKPSTEVKPPADDKVVEQEKQ